MALLLLGLKVSLLSPGFYKASLRESEIYTRTLTEFVPEQFASDEISFMMLTNDDLINVIQDSISPQWLESQAESVIDGAFFYLFGKIPSLDVTIPLSSTKESIATNLAELSNERMAEIPECTPEQLEQMEEGADLGTECLPPGAAVPELTAEHFLYGQDFMDIIPDKIDLEDTLPSDFPESPAMANLPRYYQYFQIGLWVILGSSLALMGLIVFLNWGNTSALLRRLALPLLIAAVPILAVGLAGSFYGAEFLEKSMLDATAEVSPLLTSLTETFVGSFFLRLMLPSGIAFALALVGLITAYILG